MAKTAGVARSGKDTPSGAVGTNTGFGVILDSWLRSHRSNGSKSFARMKAEPLQSLMTILVIAIAMALPAALFVVVISLQQLGGSWHNSARISVFTKRDAKPEVVQGLIKTVQAMPQMEQVTYLSPEAALAEFQQASGFGEALALLDTNPLPGVLLLSPNPTWANEASGVTALIEELKQLSGVDEVQLDLQWLQRMQQILEIGQRIAVLLGFTLSLGVLLVVGNTIRLAIESRREEIQVVKLVGGTNAFVRRPFLYTGLWYGLLGGLLAWLGVTLASLWLNRNVEKMAALYQSDFLLTDLGLRGLLVLVILGGVLGLSGAALAVGRHIARVEP